MLFISDLDSHINQVYKPNKSLQSILDLFQLFLLFVSYKGFFNEVKSSRNSYCSYKFWKLKLLFTLLGCKNERNTILLWLAWWLKMHKKKSFFPFPTWYINAMVFNNCKKYGRLHTLNKRGSSKFDEVGGLNIWVSILGKITY